MQIVSTPAADGGPVSSLVPGVDAAYLEQVVRSIAIPRHYLAEPHNNRKVRDWIMREFASFGMQVTLQGECENIVASYAGTDSPFTLLVGAHYDSVPRSPGADDNASAVAGLLALAKSFQGELDVPIQFVAFNREEDGLLGSREYVGSLSDAQRGQIRCAHILEMIGYAKEGSFAISVGRR